MKIDPSKITSSSLDRTASSSRSPQGKVAIGSVASHLATLESQLSTGDFDAGKVDAIKGAIRDGKLQVNAEVVADKLIASAQALLDKKGS